MKSPDKQFSRLFERPLILNNWPYFIIAFILFPIAILYGRYIYAPSDDMYIFLVYARNFIEGNGLTYNGIVVEGFTSVVWVFLISIIGLAKFPLPQLAEVLSIFSGLLALFTTHYLAKSIGIRPAWVALLPPVLLAFTGDFTFYMSVGLEEVLFTALATLCIALRYSQPADKLLKSGYYPMLMAILILTRPEGALICALLFLTLLSRDTLPLLIRCGLMLVLFLIPVLLWKRLYYGYWLPNTWYVKGNAGFANLERGLVYFLFNAHRYVGALVIIVSTAAYGIYKNRSMIFKDVLPLALIVVIWLIYVIVQGGDNMVGGRFLVPILPGVYCIVVRLALEARLKPSGIFLSTLVLSVSLVYGYVANQGLIMQAQSWRDAFNIRKNAGIHLRDHYPKTTVLALNQAGIIPYYSGFSTIDMLGLNDLYIAHYGKRDYSLWYAHQAGDGLYVLSKKPDIILFGGLNLSPEPGDFISDREIWASNQFRSEYELVQWPGIGSAYIRSEMK